MCIRDSALAALVFNLANHHRRQGDWATALEEYRLVETWLPGFPETLGNQGAIHLQSGDRGRAREQLEAALAGDSVSAPVRHNLEVLFRSEGSP